MPVDIIQKTGGKFPSSGKVLRFCLTVRFALCDTFSMTSFYFGTMGFGFEDWENVFYPANLPQSKYLRYYSQHFNSVELDTTFYGIPSIEQIQRWSAETPTNFVFSLKTPRQITHDARLVNISDEMKRFLENIIHFEEKLGAVLIQLPPDFPIGEWEALKSFINQLPGGYRYAVEFRHPSWYQPQTAELLFNHDVCWAATEYLDLPTELRPTSDFLYIRWIGEHGQYGQKDHERVDKTAELKAWLEQIYLVLDQAAQLYGYFNNDYAGFSPATCNRFKRLLNLEVSDFSPPRQDRLF